MAELLQSFGSLAWSAGIFLVAAILGLVCHYLLFKMVNRLADRKSSALYKSLIRYIKKPSSIILPLFAIYFVLPLLEFPQNVDAFIDKLLGTLLIVCVSWLFIKLISVSEDIVLARYKIEERDNLRARKVHTQFMIIKKVLIAIIAIIAFAGILMSFSRLRYLGTGILASAGLASLIVGFAAKSAISNLLAGIQIALTQPFNVDDVVIVENEWGRIEEITLTYVVVRIWDLRRLVVPISYFIEKPFQNWTRRSADLIGSVNMHVDYAVPLQELREELHRVLQSSDLWDGKVWTLQVIDTTERTMQLRALMSASDSSSSWDLQCRVREKLINFIQEKYPEALPKLRTEVQAKTANLSAGQE